MQRADVRASDGSNFAFNDTTILFRAIPGKRRRDAARLRPRPRVLRVDAAVRARRSCATSSAASRRSACRTRRRFGAGRGARARAAQQAARRARHRGHEHRDAAAAVLEGVREPDRGAQPDREPARRDRLRARSAPKTERDRKLAEVERDQNKIIQTKRAELETQLATAVTRADPDPPRGRHLQDRQARRRPGRALGRRRARPIELKGQLDAAVLDAQGARSTRSATSRSSA